MLELTGWIGAILFAICALPQAIQSFKDGHSRGINNLFLLFWMLGGIITLVYVLFKHGLDLPLITNYVLNIVLISVIMKYKYFPRINNG
jgi:uncharacterized protein with PQ loop repeat